MKLLNYREEGVCIYMCGYVEREREGEGRGGGEREMGREREREWGVKRACG